jgi:hypothetical protein
MARKAPVSFCYVANAPQQKAKPAIGDSHDGEPKARCANA